MADAHFTEAHKCCHCGKQFTGRKKKYCGDRCRHRRRAPIPDSKRIKPYKPRRTPNPIIDDTRKCLDCDAVKPVSEYKKINHDDKTYLSSICKLCTAEFNRKRKKEAVKKNGRNLRKERIRRHEREGKCGPPTYQQWMQLQPKRTREPGQAAIDARARANAREAFDYWIKVKAPDEWVVAYFEAAGNPWLNPRLTEAEQYRIRYRLDEEFNIRERMRSQIKKMKKKRDAATVSLLRKSIKKGVKRSRSMEANLGYGVNELKTWLEKQFTRGMTWAKFNQGEIHIDHIVPKSTFNTDDDTEFRRCWCLTNLRPAWAQDNLRKGARQEYLI